jgi:hypothetical protein
MIDKIRELLKKNTLIVVLVVLTIGIGLAETIIYYKDNGYAWYYLVSLGILNGVRMFNFNSTMRAVDVLNRMPVDLRWYEQLVHNAFFVFYFVAPLLLAAAIYSAANYLLNYKLSFLFGLRKKRIVIIGYNKYAKEIIREASAKCKDKKAAKEKDGAKQIIVLYSASLSDADRAFLRKNRAIFQAYDRNELDDAQKRKQLFDRLNPKKIECIILFEEDELLNYANYLAIDQYISQGPNDDFSRVRIDCNYNTSQIEERIYDYYSHISDKKYELSTFSIPMLRVQKALQDHPIASSLDEEVHLLCIGFGRMGARFLKRAINQGVTGADNRIIVDIVDMDDKQSAWYFMGINPTYYDSEKHQIHIVNPVADGELLIRFHALDVRDSSFLLKLKDLNTYTYIAICLDNAAISLNCLQRLKQYYESMAKDRKPTILVRLDTENSFEQLNDSENKIYIMPSAADATRLADIQHKQLQAISYEIHKQDTSDDIKMDSFYNEARTYRLLHYRIKEEIVKKISKEESQDLLEILGENSPDIANREETDAFAKKISENPTLMRLGAIEHRRWAYHKILNGFSQNIEERSNFKRTVQHLVTFKELLGNEQLNTRLADEYKDWKVLLKQRSKGEI